MAAAHDLELATRFCARLALLHQGAVLAEGPPPIPSNQRQSVAGMASLRSPTLTRSPGICGWRFCRGG